MGAKESYEKLRTCYMYAVFTSTEGTPLANFIYLGDKQGELWVWITRTSKQTDLGLCAFRECPAALRYSVWRDGIGIGCCRTGEAAHG